MPSVSSPRWYLWGAILKKIRETSFRPQIALKQSTTTLSYCQVENPLPIKERKNSSPLAA